VPSNVAASFPAEHFPGLSVIWSKNGFGPFGGLYFTPWHVGPAFDAKLDRNQRTSMNEALNK
jgi:hypothetical protein